MEENRASQRLFGMKPHVLLIVVAVIAAVSVVVIIRQSFKEKSAKLAPVAAERKQAAERDVAVLREEVRREPKSARAHRDLGRALVRAGRAEEALAPLRRAVELDRDFSGAFFDLARTSKALGRNEEAAAAYEEVVRIDPENAEAYYELGLTQAAMGEGAEAADSFERAVELDSAYAEEIPPTEIAEVEEASPTEAEDAGTEDAEEDDEEEGQEEEAAAAAADDDGAFATPQMSQEALADSMLFDNESFDMNMGMGSLYSSLGRHGNAVIAFGKAVGLEPTSAAAHLGLGLSHLGAGDRPAAIAEYNTLTTLDPAMAAKLLEALNE